MPHKHDEPPGLLAKLLIAFCLAAVASFTSASLVGMLGAFDRVTHPYATDCEAAAEFCEE